jgi:acyl carrier protein
MNEFTSDKVRQFLLRKYAEPIKALGLDPLLVSDDFDFLMTGVIDSFGILEMINSIEDEFRIQLDLETLDASEITILGPLSRYVAKRGCFRPEGFPDSDKARA